MRNELFWYEMDIELEKAEMLKLSIGRTFYKEDYEHRQDRIIELIFYGKRYGDY